MKTWIKHFKQALNWDALFWGLMSHFLLNILLAKWDTDQIWACLTFRAQTNLHLNFQGKDIIVRIIYFDTYFF